jgi:serine/threonine protein kinase
MPTELAIGSRVQRFEVIGHLGTGGMGSVFRAHDPELERDVAIKLVARRPPTAEELSETRTLDLRSSGPATADALLHEARLMARLSHPNVLPVYEVGLIDGAVFVVMEHIEGHDLRTWLERRRTRHEIIGVFLQAGRGLAAAHRCGIVHRDFKPENVLVGADGRVRVADFGLSRASTRPTRNAMRRVEQPHGTPRYMASELWRGDEATPRSDVYAFCIALIEALGGPEALYEHTFPPVVRDTLIAGTAESYRTRPELEEILDALVGTTPAPRRSAITIVVACALTLGGLAALMLSP